MTGLVHDCRLACRRLRQAPTLTAFAIVTMAFGIGAVAAVSSTIRAVTGPPPGIAEPDDVLRIHRAPAGNLPIVGWSWPDFQDFTQRQTSFSGVTGFGFFRPALTSGTVSSTGTGEVVDGNYFDVLGVAVTLGRALSAGDDRPSSSPACVISDRTWRTLFAGRADVVGQILTISGHPFQVVGVAPEEFAGLFNGGLARTHVWIPFSAARRFPQFVGFSFDPNSRERRWLMTFGRLAPRVSAAAASAEVAGLGRQFDAALSAELGSRASVRTAWGASPLSRLMGVPDAFIDGLIIAISVAVALVGLTACTNIANLMLARQARRRSDMAVRAALGATRGRLLREASSEAVVLMLTGGLLGLPVAYGLMRVFSTELTLGTLSLQVLPQFDLWSFAAAVATAAAAVLVVGIIPATMSTRSALAGHVAGAAYSAVPRWRARRLLIAGHVASSVLLVSITMLYVGEVRRYQSIDSGLDLEHLAFMHVDFGLQGRSVAEAERLASAVLDRIAVRPGVESVAASVGYPLEVGRFAGGAVRSAGVPETHAARIVAGTPDLLRTLGLSVTRGRGFDARDTAATEPVVVISESLEARLFEVDGAIGRSIMLTSGRFAGDPERPDRVATVVGVVPDTDAGYIGRRAMGIAYVPLPQDRGANLVLSARARQEPDLLARELQRTLATLAPDVAASQVGTGASLVGAETLFARVVAGVAGTLGTVALTLAIAGLYGVLSFAVTSRTREIGLRAALGATPGQIKRLVLREGLGPVVLGLVVGLGAGVFARAALQGMLVRLVPAVDASLVVAVCVLFTVVGTLACYLPARRASRIDPNVALRMP